MGTLFYYVDNLDLLRRYLADGGVGNEKHRRLLEPRSGRRVVSFVPKPKKTG